ncbi:MAG: serine protease [Planctomycetes bacterium]|nr:serine protease [Planctomycetota bacterium]
MAAWNELLAELEGQPEVEKANWLKRRLEAELHRVGQLRGDRNVVLYASAFLQKPGIPQPWISLTGEEVNGLMSVIYGMDFRKKLTLILHTPGGITNAAESMVSYLHSKFDDIEVIVPTYAMSAGTMICLGSNRIVMGRQSQLGPIDPQLPLSNRFISARAIVDQFVAAKKEILKNRVAAHIWAPILQSMGPALLVEASNALAYGQKMVEGWLEQRMFRGVERASARRNKAKRAAKYFNDAGLHKSHGRRIGRDEGRQYVEIEDLESNQELQDAALTAYHLATIAFEHSPVTKLLQSHHGRSWFKNWASPRPV